ncbi:MAG: gliding motility protein GldL [Bacteroidales bacterium]|jgi:gliding motility-associated protein GldL|nr:gliding motility protein GldL [Bacteroidales bacterium]
MSLADIVHSSGWKAGMAKLYGFGASVVIVGALFKIQHWPAAGTLLTIGLLTEATIFFFSAFEPLHEEPDWTLVYPELAGIGEEGETSRGRSVGGGAGATALAKFDEMLVNADISPDLFHKLGTGMKKLGDASAAFAGMGDAAAVSSDYIKSVKNASESLGKLNDTYQETASVIHESNKSYRNIADSLSVVESSGKSYQQQIETLNKNLSALNAVYELQLRNNNDHVKESEALYKGLQGMVKDLSESAGDAKKYKEHIVALNENLSALNNVYGNMLAAMNIK